MQQDIVDAMNVSNPIVSVPALEKVSQWFLHRYWWNVCECTSSATPPPPTMSNPNTSIGVNTGAPSGLNAGPCWTGYGPVHIDQTGFFAMSFIAPWLPFLPGSTANLPGNNFNPKSLPPPGVQTITWDITLLAASQPMTMRLEDLAANGAAGTLTTIFTNQSSGHFTGSFAYNSNTTSPYLDFEFGPAATDDGHWTADMVGQVSFTCSSAPPNALVMPCCPPDPLIDGKLDQLLGLVTALYNRQTGALTQYRKGTLHTALSGAGTLTVNDLVGVQVSIDTPPAGLVQGGNPPYLFDQGWLSILTGDGMIQEQRLTRTHQLWLPELMPLATTFGYYLNSGVVADVTELLPV